MKRTASWYVRRPRSGSFYWKYDHWAAGSWDDEADYRYFPTWREAFTYACCRSRFDSGGVDGLYLLAVAILVAVALVYVAVCAQAVR